MGFFANASDFIVEGNQPPPNVPQLMIEVANIVQNATSGLSSGCKLIYLFQYITLIMNRQIILTVLCNPWTQTRRVTWRKSYPGKTLLYEL
jgi:hypothetical protein